MAREGLFCFVFVFLCITASGQDSAKGFGSAKYVLILGCDGLGADYLIQANNTPNFDLLRSTGSYTFEARNVWPTWSLPNWASILTSGGTEETGVPGNSWYDTTNCHPYGSIYSPQCLLCSTCEVVSTGLLTGFQYLPNLYNLTETELDNYIHSQCENFPGVEDKLCNEIGDTIVDFIISGGLVVAADANEICQAAKLCARFLRPITGPSFPSVFAAAKSGKPGMKIACYTDWTGINQLVEPNTVDFFHYANAGAPFRSSTIVSELIDVIEEHTPELSFIHFDDIDETGHANGWGSEKYYEAVSLVDYEIGLLTDAYESAGILNETLILVISDHGGQTAGHGFTNQKNIQIPWIAKGPGINEDYIFTSYMRNMDTPATALYALGIEQPKLWMGRPATEAWTGEPVQSPAAPDSALVTNVINVVISGMNSIGFRLAPTPTMDSLVSAGAFAEFARAQMPTTTLTNIASIIMGSGPEETGVCQGPFPDANSNSCEWNGAGDSLVPPISGAGSLFPSIYQVLADNNVTNSAAVYRFANISKLIGPKTVTQVLETSDRRVATQTISLLSQSNPPAYLFAQFWDVQTAGMEHGFESPEYLKEITKVDLLLNEIVQKLPTNTLLIVTSDHGGQARSNGNLDDSSIIIPFIAYAPQVVKSGYRIPGHTRNMDAAAISLLALGFRQPVYWVSDTHSDIISEK